MSSVKDIAAHDGGGWCLGRFPYSYKFDDQFNGLDAGWLSLQ